MSFFEYMNVVLSSLGEGASVVEVPSNQIPTPKSLDNLNKRLSARIRENDNKLYRSFKCKKRHTM